MSSPNAEQLIAKAKQLVETEQLGSSSAKYEENDPRLIEAALEVAESSKSILGGLYFDFRKRDDGLIRKARNFVIGKIANIVRNTLERPLLSQQKFNEQSFYLTKLLLAENKKQKAEIAEIKTELKKLIK